MKELESTLGSAVGGGFFLVGLAPEPRVSGEGSPRVAPTQIARIAPRPWMFAVMAGSSIDPSRVWLH